MTVPCLLQVSHETSVGPHAGNSCQGWACHGSWSMGTTFLLSAPMDWLKIKLNRSLAITKLWQTPEVCLWLHPLYCCTLQQGDVVCKIGAVVIWQTQSLLVGNLKSPNGRDPVTTVCLPHGRDTWSVKSWKSQTLQFQCTGRIVLNSVSNYW